jgi:hypothetical protein
MKKVHFLTDKPLEEEKPFLELANEVFRTSFPNPERKDCPGREDLRSIAFHQFDHHTKGVMFHVTECSPCSEEFSQYCREYRARKHARTFWIMKIAASLFVVLGISLWFWLRLARNPFNSNEIALQQPAPVASSPDKAESPNLAAVTFPLTETVTLDLSARMALRDGSPPPKSASAIPWEIPRKPLNLSLLLPPGNEPGLYEVRLLASNAQIKGSGEARLAEHSVVVKVQLDTSGLPAGMCQLGIRQRGFEWSEFPVSLK